MIIYKYRGNKFLGQFLVIDQYNEWYLGKNIDHDYKECFHKVEVQHQADDIYIYKEQIVVKKYRKYKKKNDDERFRKYQKERNYQ